MSTLSTTHTRCFTSPLSMFDSSLPVSPSSPLWRAICLQPVGASGSSVPHSACSGHRSGSMPRGEVRLPFRGRVLQLLQWVHVSHRVRVSCGVPLPGWTVRRRCRQRRLHSVSNGGTVLARCCCKPERVQQLQHRVLRGHVRHVRVQERVGERLDGVGGCGGCGGQLLVPAVQQQCSEQDGRQGDVRGAWTQGTPAHSEAGLTVGFRLFFLLACGPFSFVVRLVCRERGVGWGSCEWGYGCTLQD